MALTRAFLTGMGLSADQVSAVIEAHTETVDALKAQRDEYKTKAESNIAPEELERLKAGTKEAEEWKAKFEKASSDLENYKTEQSTKEAKAAKESAYKELLKAAGVSDKRIDTVMKVTSLEDVELDKEGKLKNTEKLTEAIKKEWSDFIVTTEQQGANTQTPPAGSTGSTDYENMSMEEYIAARKK